MTTMPLLPPIARAAFGDDEPTLETDLFRVIDAEALLRGARGLTSVSISVRFLDEVEVWLYTADMVAVAPGRGLWRWTPDTWEFLGGNARGTDPAAVIRRVQSESAWVKLPRIAADRERALRVLRLVTAPPTMAS